MKKSYLTLSVAALLAASASATAAGVPDGMSFYGKASVQVMNSDKGIMNFADEGTTVDTPYNRFGVKGTTKLTENNLHMIYKFEWQIRGADQQSGKADDTFSARNTYIGLKGNFGEVVLGKNDTRFKGSEGKVDQFNELAGDIAQILPGQDRVGDSATYISPKMGQVQFALTYTFEDDYYDGEDGDAGYAGTLFIGDKNGKKQPYFVALSMVDSINNLDAYRVTAQYKLGQLALGAIFQDSEQTEGELDGSGYIVSAAYTMDKWVAKAQWGTDDSGIRNKANEEADMWSVGVDYKWSKAARAFAYYTALDLDTDDDNAVGVGIEYKF